MTWTQYDKRVNATGTFIAYGTPGQSEIWIQSRKLHIPHANGSGTWDHTTSKPSNSSRLIPRFMACSSPSLT